MGDGERDKSETREMEFKSVCVNTCEFDTKDSEEQKERSLIHFIRPYNCKK